jgi:hypothetical protein
MQPIIITNQNPNTVAPKKHKNVKAKMSAQGFSDQEKQYGIDCKKPLSHARRLHK